MADEEPETFIQKISRQKMLSLRPAGGRVFVENATVDKLDCCKIELKCWWSPGLLAIFDSSIHIGDDKHKPLMWNEEDVQVPDEQADDVLGWSLLDCPIMLLIHRVEDGWLADNAKRKDDAILGQFNFSAPMKTDDGVVNDTRPTINAWIALGADNFRLLRDRITATDKPDFELGIEVEFPRGTVETGWVKSKVEWDGKGSLPITRATIVWERADWNSHADRDRSVLRPPPPVEYEPPREHVELLGAVDQLQAAVVKLTTPIWIAAAGALVAAVVLIGR